jgi:hypothetical protein
METDEYPRTSYDGTTCFTTRKLLGRNIVKLIQNKGWNLSNIMIKDQATIGVTKRW